MAQTLTAYTLDLGTLKQVNGARSKAAPILARLQELGKQMSQSMQQMVYDRKSIFSSRPYRRLDSLNRNGSCGSVYCSGAPALIQSIMIWISESVNFPEGGIMVPICCVPWSFWTNRLLSASPGMTTGA